MNDEARELIEAMKDCCERILRGDDPGYLWMTTLHAHAYVFANDFTIFGTPLPSTVPSETPK
jgi:hypothetical protein